MRILCLHGKGTSAEIFSIQSAAFRSRLPSSYKFDFLDGPYTSPPAAGVSLFFNPPYYAYYDSTDPSAIRESYSFLQQHIDKNGPYDGVMCFSQGCALVAGFLLDHQVTRPHIPLPFKCAVFICGGVPLPIIEDLGIEIPEKARALEAQSVKELFATAAAVETAQPGDDYWNTKAEKSSILNVENIDLENPYGLVVPEGWKIQIPTVHVYGKKDPRWLASLNLASFCAGKRKVWDHGGGHDIPRFLAVSDEIAGLIKWCAKAVGDEIEAEGR
ncbi:hypothetical protein DSL72_000278 [Monilinia vaccinii-corymbosi]|uniref:Serine hydrolase domain-containing protein n=1 Tax=Monilinia vaccinii-corymbosi TaxID=61207 RepID=A0A8A3P2I9_9HELO|nr:hypothetical protein DSL72_000278 [Monilinia vaccinii-corymbosi]